MVIAAGRSSSEPNYAYTLEIESNAAHLTARVDPSLPLGERVEVLIATNSILDHELSDLIQHIDKTAARDFFCSRLNRFIPTLDSPISVETGTETFVFAPIARSKSQEDRILRHVLGTVTQDIRTGEIVSLRLTSQGAFKLSFMIKIRSFEAIFECQPTPDGRTYAARSFTRVLGTAAFQSFEEKEVITISNITTLKGG